MTIKISDYIWLDEVVEKIESDHHVIEGEAEEVFAKKFKCKKQTPQVDPLPEDFRSLKEFWSFWDSHSSADYEDLMEDVDVEIDPGSSKVYFPVAKDLISHIKTQAREQGVSAETLINLWLREKVSEATHSR